ncbi:MAG: hypothetical protein RMJ87_13330 [Cytophagales bacterium]|nr:hypothetical protein [Bernardetiaceae bacterium]MDW8206004.1 hypothetical protein [Cytophagales bacterium]
MRTFNQLLRLAQENQEVAVFMVIAAFLILLIIYLLIRSIFSPRRSTSVPTTPPAYVPVAELATQLRQVAQQALVVLEQLEQSIAEKDRSISEKQQYIESLNAQIRQLQEQITTAGAAPVVSRSERQTYEQKISDLQKNMQSKATSKWWGGFVWGILLALLAAAGTYAYLVQPEWLVAFLNR